MTFRSDGTGVSAFEGGLEQVLSLERGLGLQARELGLELLHVLELPVDGGEAHIGDAVELLQAPQGKVADPLGVRAVAVCAQLTAKNAVTEPPEGTVTVCGLSPLTLQFAATPERATLCWPAARADRLRLAVPFVSATAPPKAEPSTWNCTEPVGVPKTLRLAATVAVKVTC